MQFQQPDTGSLNFLEQSRVESEPFSLSTGELVLIQKFFLHFKPWQGTPIENTYNGKAVIDWNGEPVFAELAVLRLFQSHGWDGVWVDSYRRKYRVGLPDVVEPVALPPEIDQLVESIRAKTGRSGGCWDVLVWKGTQVLFLELKRSKKDRIQESQTQWLEESFKYGFKSDNFGLIEWRLLPVSETLSRC